jgi:hypothetical protein
MLGILVVTYFICRQLKKGMTETRPKRNWRTLLNGTLKTPVRIFGSIIADRLVKTEAISYARPHMAGHPKRENSSNSPTPLL